MSESHSVESVVQASSQPVKDQQLSRRDFFRKLFLQNTKNESSAPPAERISTSDSSSRSMESFLKKLGEIQISRRKAVMGIGVPAAALAADQILTKGRFLYYGVQLLTNNLFREKLFDSIKTGEIAEDLEHLEKTLQHDVPPNFELGEQLTVAEPWVAESFSHSEVRAVHNSETKTSNALLIADIERAQVISAEKDQVTSLLQAVNFSKTAAQSEPFATLPANQQFVNSRTNMIEPSLYSAYQTKSGKVEFWDAKTGGFDKRGGALVVQDGKPLIVDVAQVGKYEVGRNCEALEVMSFVIRSDHLAEDLKDMNESGSLAMNDLINDPRYNSFLATFYDVNAIAHTVLIGTYHPEKKNTEILEWSSNDRLTVARALDLFEQIRLERNYARFDMQVPDPDYSYVTSSSTMEESSGKHVSDTSSKSSLAEKHGWKFHPVLDGKDSVAKIQGRQYFIVSTR